MKTKIILTTVALLTALFFSTGNAASVIPPESDSTVIFSGSWNYPELPDPIFPFFTFESILITYPVDSMYIPFFKAIESNIKIGQSPTNIGYPDSSCVSVMGKPRSPQPPTTANSLKTPVPGAFWLLASGLMAFVGFRRGFRGR
jgi:hypothetical protein